MVPAGFDVRAFEAQGSLRQGTLLAGRNVDDPALGVDAAEGQGQWPAQDEITESAGVEDEDVAANHSFNLENKRNTNLHESNTNLHEGNQRLVAGS